MKKNSASVKQPGPTITFDLIVELLFLATIFLVPTIFDRRLGIVFSGAKIAWLRAFVIVTLSFWVVKLFMARKNVFFRTPLDWPVSSYLFTTTIATLTSIHVYTSFTGFYGRYEGLSTWYLYGLLFFITVNFINSRVQLKRLIMTIVPAAVLMSVYSIIQRHELDPYMWGGVVTWQRVIGTIGQPNFIAAYVIMAFFLTLILYLEEKNEPGPIDWYQQLPPLGYFLGGQILFVIMIYSLDAQDVVVWYAGWALVTAAALLFAFTYEKLHVLVREAVLGLSLLLMYV
ncbi:MAG TPA: hypothetical protein VMT55_00485, partial [Candidatus Sulfotelmatobacter sp.]|nr:hypothetical protein [Candidatus Sulfotelmatobacter sp.]